MGLSPCRFEREKGRKCRWVSGLKRPVELAGSGFLKIFEEEADGVAVAWCGIEEEAGQF